MPKQVVVSFLGTSSGGGPTDKRACSSLVLNLSDGRELWMVDMAEGTMRQFYHQRLGLKPGKVKKIFITHLHLDHCNGVPGFLANMLRGIIKTQPGPSIIKRPPVIEIYGLAGLRSLIRTVLTMTSCVLNEPYAVHELLTQEDSPTSCEQSQLCSGEVRGRDIRCGEDGLWRNILQSTFANVDAGPIEHRAPCLGYVFTTNEFTPEFSRKVVILGDTSDPSAIAPLAMDADLLVHEATDASIPNTVDPKAKDHKRTPAFVEAQAKERGHSTPGMAGEFAKSIRAKRLVLNHLGARFPPADGPGTRNTRTIREIERQAMVACGLPANAVQAAYDFLSVSIEDNTIPPRETGYDPRNTTERRDEGVKYSSHRHWKRVKY